jgi:protein translocase SecG subunit
MSGILSWMQIIVGIILVGLIIIQAKGTGLGSGFGGDMGFYSTKRGAEKFIFVATIIFGAIFLLIPLIAVAG